MFLHLGHFTKTERALWGGSVFLILLSFVLFDRTNFLTLFASLIGVTSLILSAKGNPTGQALMVLFSLLYGVISFHFSYYGEMITYLGMTMPMAVASLISWMRHPYAGKKSEVQVNTLHKKELPFLVLSTAAITLLFYDILRAFHTANLLPSTVSVATSFLAVYLTFRRSAFFALAYAANDLVLIVLWALAARQDPRYLSVIVCFAAFLLNDLYGFFSWKKMQQRQQ